MHLLKPVAIIFLIKIIEYNKLRLEMELAATGVILKKKIRYAPVSNFFELFLQ